ncbi:MAG: DUF5990 family protein [Xanthobacteraceae bacterium]
MAVQKKRSISVRIGFGALPVRDGEATEFGLQDKAGVVHAAKRASKTRSVFACELTVGSDTGTPTLGGSFAQGPPSGRFLYLSWRRIGGTGWIERVKIPLSMSANQIRTALRTGQTLETDVTGRRPHASEAVTWRLTAPA